MGKITSLIRRAPKRLSAAVAIIAAAIIVPAAVFAWGPSRATFTIAHPADYVTFNSITDNPSHGDERNFMQVREANASNTTYADEISLQADHEYVVYVYYHNNAKTSLNASGVGIAHGAYTKAQIPATVAKGSTGTKAVGYVGAANSNPGQVWDDISFKNATANDMSLAFVPGSATIHNFGKSNGMTMADSIVSTGAPLGYDALNGDVPGCNQYAGFVTFRVKATQPSFTVAKDVRVAGQTEYKESVTANPGDTLEYRIQYTNTGSTKQENVIIKDTLPAHVTYVKGSTTVKNSSNPNGTSVPDGVTTTGININGYTAGSNAYVKFSAKVGAKAELVCGTNTLTNTASATVGYDSKSDTATTIVNTTCEKDITVCELATSKIVTIKESQFDSKKYSKDLKDCEKITVCELATKKIVTIKASQFDAKKYSKDLKDCETPSKIVVCELATKKIVTINTSEFDAKKYSKNLDDCKTVEKITVCEIATKAIVTIDASAFNTDKYTKDLSKCATTPPELPKTGPTENIVAVLGLGALIASIGYYIASRRALNQ